MGKRDPYYAMLIAEKSLESKYAVTAAQRIAHKAIMQALKSKEQ